MIATSVEQIIIYLFFQKKKAVNVAKARKIHTDLVAAFDAKTTTSTSISPTTGSPSTPPSTQHQDAPTYITLEDNVTPHGPPPTVDHISLSS